MECSLENIAQRLQTAQNIVVTMHVNPDGDCLGSALALQRYLCFLGKTVYVYLDDEVPNLYRFLPDIEKVTRPAEGIKADLLVILDASDFERIGRVGSLIQAPVVNIDHHISNTGFADYWFINSQAAATGEIIYELLSNVKATIDRQIATCLFTAIATDCGFFRYPNTSAHTMRCAADLVEYGAVPHEIAEQLDTKSLNTMLSTIKVLETLEFFCGGKIATITVPPAEVDNSDSTEGLINYPRNIAGVEVAIMFKAMDAHAAKVSLRSKNVDVSKIALSFGGGGHVRAAGCSVQGTIDKVKEKVVTAVTMHIMETST